VIEKVFFYKNEKLSLHEAFATSLVVGLAETYFIAYALHLGASVIQSGLLSSLPLLFAGFSPFLLRKVFHRFTNSTWVMLACSLQGLSIAMLALIGAFSFNHSKEFSFYSLLVLFSLYWFGHFSALPSWNKWISELMPPEKSEKYFSARSRRIQIGTILGLMAGGFSLQFQFFNISTTLLFIILFLTAYHFKMLSFFLFSRQTESKTQYDLSWQRALHFLKRHQGFFWVYSIFNTSLFLSSPYVSGYLLSVRGLHYQDYMWVMAAFFAGKILTTMFLDHMRRDWSPHQIYFWGGLIAAPLPAFWPLCDTVFLLCVLHFVSGWGWAAWEVGMSLAIFKKINAHEKIEAVTMYNMIGLPTQVLGTVIGAFALKYYFQENYAILFLVAGVSRLIFVIPLYFQKFGEN
jgi:MFS family permease